MDCSTCPWSVSYNAELSKEASSTIFWVFGITYPGIEPWSSGPWSISFVVIYVYIYLNINNRGEDRSWFPNKFNPKKKVLFIFLYVKGLWSEILILDNTFRIDVNYMMRIMEKKILLTSIKQRNNKIPWVLLFDWLEIKLMGSSTLTASVQQPRVSPRVLQNRLLCWFGDALQYTRLEIINWGIPLNTLQERRKYESHQLKTLVSTVKSDLELMSVSSLLGICRWKLWMAVHHEMYCYQSRIAATRKRIQSNKVRCLNPTPHTHTYTHTYIHIIFFVSPMREKYIFQNELHFKWICVFRFNFI